VQEFFKHKRSFSTFTPSIYRQSHHAQDRIRDYQLQRPVSWAVVAWLPFNQCMGWATLLPLLTITLLGDQFNSISGVLLVLKLAGDRLALGTVMALGYLARRVYADRRCHHSPELAATGVLIFSGTSPLQVPHGHFKTS
jgi:hypothetical protein